MKYAICGFSQAAALEMVRKEERRGKLETIRIDATDLLILRWFVDFYPKMKRSVIDGREYAWLKHSELAVDMPILGISARSCIARMKKLVSFGILDYKLVKKDGTWSFYTFGENYARLVSKECDQTTEGVRSNAQGVYVQTHTPVYVQTYDKDPSTIDPSTRDSSSSSAKADYDEWREAYEQCATAFARIRVMSDKRKRAVRSMKKQGITLDDFREALRKACRSKFLTGGGPRGWKADPDWLFNPDNVLKILEGRYDDAAPNDGFMRHDPSEYAESLHGDDPRFLPGGIYEGSWC